MMLTQKRPVKRKNKIYFSINSNKERVIHKQQKTIVIVVAVLMITVIISTIWWGTSKALSESPEVNITRVLFPNFNEEFYPNAAVSSDSKDCPPIGRSVLLRGGSAVDATIAMLFCQGVVDPHRSGIGGGMVMLVYQRDKKVTVAIDARETAPYQAHKDMFHKNLNASARGGLAIAVPGELLGLWEAHKKFGVLPWGELVLPSIKLCEKGVKVSNHLATNLQQNKDLILNDPLLREVFTNSSSGELLMVGDVMKNHRLVKTLKTIAKQGACALYRGNLGLALLIDICRARGIIKLKDLYLYKTIWKQPLIKSLQVHNETLDMMTFPPPGGGAILLHILKILEGYNMTNVNNHSVITLHRITEAFKYAFAKRSKLADPDYVNITQVLGELLSKELAEAERQNIDDYKTAVNINSYGSTFSQSEDSGTSHVSVIASNGDAVAATSSINLNFGSGVISNSTGILMNDEMDDFSMPNTTSRWGTMPSETNFVYPGKRPLSSMCPVIIVDEKGDVRLVIGGSGGIRIITSVALVLVRYLWLKQSIKEAINGKRIHHQLVPNILEYEHGLDEEAVEGLKARGHDMKDLEHWISFVNAIEQKPSGGLVANSDFRKEGAVSGL